MGTIGSGTETPRAPQPGQDAPTPPEPTTDAVPTQPDGTVRESGFADATGAAEG